MKQNPNQVPTQHATKAAAQQDKIYKSTPADRARRIDLIVCDVRGEHLGGELNQIGGISLTTADWKVIQKDASARGEGSNAWLDRVITEKILEATSNGAPAIQSALDLIPAEIRAVEILSEWESESPAEFCRAAVIARIESSCDDLRSNALWSTPEFVQVRKRWKVGTKGNVTAKEQAWARKF